MSEEPDYERRLNEVNRISLITHEIRWIIDNAYRTLNFSTYPPKDVETARMNLGVAWTLAEFCEYRNFWIMETDGGEGILSDETNKLLEKLISAIEKHLEYSDEYHTRKLDDSLKEIRTFSDMAVALENTLKATISRWQWEPW